MFFLPPSDAAHAGRHRRGDVAGIDKATGAETLRAQAAFTRTSFEGQLENLKAGKGIGGRGLTVAYGLWTMKLADAPADDLTAAMITFLLKTQAEDGHWQGQSVRPPMEESLAMCTTIALVGLQHFAAKTSEPRRNRRRRRQGPRVSGRARAQKPGGPQRPAVGT